MLRHSHETKNEVCVKLSSVKKNELRDAGIGKKIVILRDGTDSEYEVGSARNSRINSITQRRPKLLASLSLTTHVVN